MVYDFPEINRKYPHLRSAMLSKGRLFNHNLNIALPDGFDFNSPVPPIPLALPAGKGMFDNVIVPNKEWPLNVQYLKAKAIESDTGLGDIINREIAPINSEPYKEWFKATFGRSCACNWTLAIVNKKYPL